MLIVYNEPEFERVFRTTTGPVGLHIAKLARRCTKTAKAYANVSPAGDLDAGRPPGYMRSRIRWDMGRLIEVYADVSSPARTARDNAPYGLFMEVGTRPHIIRPKKPGGWLRWTDKGGTKFALYTNHPGTRPYAYLRRALYSLRGA